MIFTNITDKTMTKILVIKQLIDWTISLQQAIKKLKKSERTIYMYKKKLLLNIDINDSFTDLLENLLTTKSIKLTNSKEVLLILTYSSC